MVGHREKFQDLLREMFQFDCSDLNFGIYRIMNFKREAVEQFIQKDLLDAVNKELSTGALASQSQVAQELGDVADEIREIMGEAVIDGEGVLKQFCDTPLGKRYLDLQGRASGASTRPALEAAIFNHLYAFFSRYYDAGDFLSKRRYSRKEKYAIPYNGEEVYLHWANSDQYYVKTGEYFTDYRYKAPNGVTVHFRLQQADVPQNNVKGDKRFFIPLPEGAHFDAEAKEVVVPFEFRPLNEAEQTKYGQRNQQDTILAEVTEALPSRLKDHDAALAAVVARHHQMSDGTEVSFLAHHLRQYAQKNTSDFFIHKDLKGFLARELDFYLKNEVLNLDEMEAAGEIRAEGWFQIMRVIKAVGGRIIDFLAQIEDFQKKLFEKKKFITETQYCITVSNIAEEFYGKIAACEAQWAEWKELFHIDEEEKTLFNSSAKSRPDRRVAFLKAHPTLVLDTKHFDQDFRDRLLASFEDLDAMTDGLLVQSENFQALNLLLEKYREKVKCIYIDPPYNTGGSTFVYKNGYKHSSWMAMISNVVRLGAEFLSHEGVNITAIDDYELSELDLILGTAFGEAGRLGILVVENKPSGRTNDMFLATSHEYYLCHSRYPEDTSINFFPLTEEEKARYVHTDGVSSYKWRDFLRTGGYSTPAERPNSYYPIYVAPTTGELSLEKSKDAIEILPIDSSGRKRVWRKTKPSFLEHLEKGEVRAKEMGPGRYKVEIIDRIKEGTRPKSVWVGARYDAATYGTKLLKDILGEGHQFDFPKSVLAVRDAIFCVTDSDDGDIVLDFFAGSGTTAHAAVALNREDEANRQFVLVEMGQYFDTVLLPRIKKVIFSPEWKGTKPVRQATEEEAKRSPRIVKYTRLESYEDALNNIMFTDAPKTLYDFDDYLLHYMLDWETKESATFLNMEQLARPFSYKLQIARGQETQDKVVDIPETFAYLLGMHVTTRRVYADKDRRYLVYRGRIDHREIAVIWRDTAGWDKGDYERDKKFVADQKLAEGADEVFVNGDSLIPNARTLDGVFKSRMFAEIPI